MGIANHERMMKALESLWGLATYSCTRFPELIELVAVCKPGAKTRLCCWRWNLQPAPLAASGFTLLNRRYLGGVTLRRRLICCCC